MISKVVLLTLLNLACVTANLGLDDRMNIGLSAKSYDVLTLQKSLTAATQKALARVKDTKRSLMKPWSLMLKNYMSMVQISSSKCNTMELAECMYETKLKRAGGIKSQELMCANPSSDCSSINFGQILSSERSVFQKDKTDGQFQKQIDEVHREIAEDFHEGFELSQVNLAAIEADYSAQMKSMYKLWGCNDACLQEQTLEDLASAKSLSGCHCQEFKVTRSKPTFLTATTTSTTNSTSNKTEPW